MTCLCGYADHGINYSISISLPHGREIEPVKSALIVRLAEQGERQQRTQATVLRLTVP